MVYIKHTTKVFFGSKLKYPFKEFHELSLKALVLKYYNTYNGNFIFKNEIQFKFIETYVGTIMRK